jgi:hypothetical protein
MKPLAGEERNKSLYRTRTTNKSGGNWLQAIVIKDFDGSGDNTNHEVNQINDIRN